jgi:16S rRNA (adenine1518-N6/adenine1519-N6)-dimethyltransferase
VERIVRAAFGKRRKTLVNALLQSGVLEPPRVETLRAALCDLGIDARARGETLTPQQFLDLTRALVENLESPGAA